MNEIVVNKDNNTEISFALSKEVLADVLFKFLGKKEKLSYQKITDFVLTLNDIKQFYHLLRNKIDKEKTTEVEFFQAAIFYDDDTNRGFTSYEQLESYYEEKNVVPSYVIMNWDIIVNFPNSKSVETQKIELTYGINDDEECFITLVINHTNHIWATEVQNLFINQINKTITPKDHRAVFLAKFKISFKSFLIHASLIIVLLLLFFGMFSKGFLTNKPNYYEELLNRNITIVEKGDIKKLILLSSLSENKKLLGIEIINNYDGSYCWSYSKRIFQIKKY